MFRNQPNDRLPAGLVPDDATAQAHALGLQPAFGASTAPATVIAAIRGQGLFLTIVVDADLSAVDREVVAELARAEVVRLLRYGTSEGDRAWDSARREWRTFVYRPDVLSEPVPDHVPDEWVISRRPEEKRARRRGASGGSRIRRQRDPNG